MDYAALRRYYNRCNPDEPLDPDDDRNVDIDIGDVRGEKWATMLARQIALSDHPVCKLFTGLRGSGKSTELRRLAELLQRPQMNFLPVLIDADELLDQTSEIDVSDVLTMVLYATERAVLTLEQRDPDEALSRGAFRRLWEFLSKTDIHLTSAELGFAAGASGKVGFELKTQPTTRQLIRKVVAGSLGHFLREIRQELTQLEARTQAAGKAGLVVIFDSLEKIRGTSLTWRAVLASAEAIFSNDAPYLQLPVHVLYTVPPALTQRVSSVTFLPMIKVRDKFGKPSAEGMDVARMLITKRVDEAGLDELFGQHDREARLRELISWSGGYPRELMRLMQAVMELEHHPISEQGVRHILNRAGNGYRSLVRGSGAISWLRRLEQTKAFRVDNDDEREAADLFLQNNVVLRYLNAEDWYDVHPSVRRMPELAAGEAGEAAAKAGDKGAGAEGP